MLKLFFSTPGRTRGLFVLKQDSQTERPRNCAAAPLLLNYGSSRFYKFSLIFAWAAASLAIGTLNGEQET